MWTGTFSSPSRLQGLRRDARPLFCHAGGRRYRLEVAGKLGWLARYWKEVDANETTLRFRQEIYDDKGKLVETHEKLPVDTGHKKL